MSFRFTANATADAGGAVTIAFPSPNVQQGWVASVSVPESEPGVTWAVVVNGVQVATVQGASGYGPATFTSSEAIQMTATNALPGESYQGVIQGVFSNASVPAAAPLTAVATTLPMTQLGTIATAAGATSLSVPVKAFYRTLILIASQSLSATTFSVIGDVTGFHYAAAGTPLSAGAAEIVDLLGAAWDSSVTITVSGGGSGNTIWIEADQAIENQLVFAGAGGIAAHLLRSDGRAYPLGEFAQTASNTVSATLIPAPSGAQRVLLRTATLCAAAGAAGGAYTLTALEATVGGSQWDIFALNAAATPIALSESYETGLLCDAATAVTVGVAGGTPTISWVASATYDVVV